MRTANLINCLTVTLVLCAGSAGAIAQTPSKIDVLAAKRTEVLASPFGEFTPKNQADDVMLLLRIRGVSPQSFDSTAKDRRYVLAGERKCELEYTLHFETGERELAFAVPRGATELRLVLGDRPGIVIRPEATVAKQLKSPLP